MCSDVFNLYQQLSVILRILKQIDGEVSYIFFWKRKYFHIIFRRRTSLIHRNLI